MMSMVLVYLKCLKLYPFIYSFVGAVESRQPTIPLDTARRCFLVGGCAMECANPKHISNM